MPPCGAGWSSEDGKRTGMFADAAANSKDFDELYAHDSLHRLKDMERGNLNTGHTALTTTTFAQCWTLDETGNWKKFQQDDTGNGTWDLKQQRTASKVNEITDVTETAGPSWTTPAYDAAGNMTTVPQPSDPTTSFTATYDAWNRLVKLTDGASTVQENEYDARRFRTVRKDYSGGALSETRHFYYTEGWQSIEERLGTSTTPEQQHVWGLRYIDDLVVRDRDTDDNGTLDERLYAMQDANWNVTAVADEAGAVQERYEYNPYGATITLSPAFAVRATSNFSWETTYCEYRWDTATGLFAVRNRFYHSAMGIWVSRDPLQYLPNSYLYCESRTPHCLDPFGLQPDDYTLCSRFGKADLPEGEDRREFSRAQFENALGDLTPLEQICLDYGCLGLTALRQGQGKDFYRNQQGRPVAHFQNPRSFGDTKCFKTLAQAEARRCSKDKVPFIFQVRGYGRGMALSSLVTH